MSQKQKKDVIQEVQLHITDFWSKFNPIQGSQMVLALVVNFAAYIA